MTNDLDRDTWHKHLEFAQNVVTRMAQNSYLLKGWTITLVAATFILSLSLTSLWLLVAALIPTIGFALLDAYYLQQERFFRHLYDHVRRSPGEVEAFTLDPTPYRGQPRDNFWTVVWSVSIRNFYGPLLAFLVIAIVVFAIRALS